MAEPALLPVSGGQAAACHVTAGRAGQPVPQG